eukprot:Skav221765  [mRNA]  locus=scaffold490:280304:287109:+ [translate_table: standard]
MSSEEVASLRQDLEELRFEFEALRITVHDLAEQSHLFRVSASANVAASVAPASSGYEAGSASERVIASSDKEGRAQLARQIGRFLRASYEGRHFGPSGRDRLSLRSRVYVALVDYHGVRLPAPRVFREFSSLSALCMRGPSAGDSVFEEAEVHDVAFPVSHLLFREGALQEFRCCHVDVSDADAVSIVNVVLVTVMDSRFLVAVPQEAWHRTVARRVLPRSALSRPVNVEVGGDEGGSVRVWVGYFSDELVQQVLPGPSDDPGALTFLDEGGSQRFPCGESLMEFSNDHFGFLSAVSQPEPTETVAPGVSDRLGAVEATLAQIQSMLAALPKSAPSAAGTSSVVPRPSSVAAVQRVLLARMCCQRVRKKRILCQTSHSRSKAAAYQKLKAALIERPEWLFNSVEDKLVEDFNLTRSAPGASSAAASSRAWVEHRSKLGHYPATIRFAWVVAGIHDCLRAVEVQQARARCAMALCAIDQSSLDGGSWTLAQEFLLELPPPYGSFLNKRAPEPSEQIATRLADDRLMEILLWRLKDRDNFLESKKRLNNAAAARPKVPPQSPPAKAGASSVQADVWNLCFSAVSRARTGLSALFHTTLKPCACSQLAPRRAVWPMPLPFPEMHRRRSNRKQMDCGRKLGTNFLVLCLNWLSLGESLSGAPSLFLGQPLSGAQWSAVRELTPLVDSWNSHGLVDSSAMGRSASKVENVEYLLLQLEQQAVLVAADLRSYLHKHTSGKQNSSGHFGHPGAVVGSLSSEVECVAKELEPDRLQFHGVPSFDPVPFLDDRNRAQYERPLDFALSLLELECSVPSVRVRVPKKMQGRLLERLDESSRLALLPLSAVRLGLENGMFALPKDHERDRLIIDARPANRCESSEDRWVKSLGSVHQLLHVFLQEGQKLVMHCEDLRDYYHAFVIGDQRRRRNALKLCVRPWEVKHLKCFDKSMWQEEWLVPSLNTMAMGDTNSVGFGQVAHLSVLLRTGEFDLADFIGLKKRPSRKPWLCGLMIDDFVLMESVDAAFPHKESLTDGAKKMQAVHKAYSEVGLPRHAGKAVASSTKAEFWGVEVDGERGRVRPCLNRLVPLVHIILKVVQLRVCTVSLLEILSGSLVSAFQLRRRFMSVLEEVYAAQRNRSRSDIVSLSPQLVDELLLSVGLLVLTEIDLRLRPSPLLCASDASSSTRASVVAPVGEAFVGEVHRFGLQKGLWNRLMSPAASFMREKGLSGHELAELPEQEYDMHPLWEEVVSTQQFRPFTFGKRGSKREHINLSEIRAALEAEKEMGREFPRSYYVHLQDSQVSLACLVKGRSSSASVNKLLRRSIPDHVSSGIRPFYGFVRSKLNPSDDPTRGLTVRAPSRSAAAWLSDALAGSFEKLDAYLAGEGLDILGMSELPDVSELWPDINVHAHTAKQLRKERGRQQHKIKKQKQHERRCKTADDASEFSLGQPASAFPVDKVLEGTSVHAPIPSAYPPADSLRRSRGKAPGTAADASESLGVGTHDASESLGVVKHEADGLPVPPVDKVLGEGSGNTGNLATWSSIVDQLSMFRSDQFVYSRRFVSLQEALASGPGILDLFSGARGFSRAFVDSVDSWSLCFDIGHHLDENLQEPKLQRSLQTLLRAGAFRAMVASPVCASFSTAITPPWRTKEFPEGKPGLTPLQQLKIKNGHCQLGFVLSLVSICLAEGILFWIENPDGSWFWRQQGKLSWDRFLATGAVGDYRVDQCRYGTPWRKRTRFRTNSSLRDRKELCVCSSPHVVLRGRCKARKVNFTKLAESYPRRLCKMLACVFAQDLGFFPKRRRLSIGDCAKCGGCSIGEAAHPGPRRPKRADVRRQGTLDDVELLEPSTVAMRARFWSSFEGWLGESLGADVTATVLANPLLLVKALEEYGNVEFSAGTPLHYYRQLLAHVQREFPLTKPHMSIAWRVVSKWELLEPVRHRPPIPEPLVLAMSSLALSWNWPLFVAALLACFYGICRIGEVLSAERGNVLTPEDLLSDAKVLYLKICKPKTRRRGASVQYSTISEAEVVEFLGCVWQKVPTHSRLYPSSPSNFRRRWDVILQVLGVQSWHRLTPGSLRGGGCVAAHRRGVAIQDLLWKMRLQHTRTLGYYLQETTAESVFPALSSDTRDRIKAPRSLLPFQLKALQQRTT